MRTVIGGIHGWKFTRRRVDALKAGETLYDDEVKGFVVARRAVHQLPIPVP